MMTPGDKMKWVTALKSGDFKQAMQVLFDRKTGGFCCLGVALKVVNNLNESMNEKESYFPEFAGSNPFWMTEFAKMNGCTRNDVNNLAEMNDSGKSFTEIADYIEKNL